MKGGITSGVVYPFAVTGLAKRYRLRGVGGSSAGAIAATLAAAAERRRQASPNSDDDSGFAQIEAIGRELPLSMRNLMQPTPAFKGLFELLLAFVSTPREGNSKLSRIIMAAASLCLVPLYLGSVVVVAGAAAAIGLSDFGWLVAGLIAGPGITIVLAAIILGRLIFKELPANRFGMLPGITQDPDKGPGLTDWLADNIDLVAGNVDGDGMPADPLTVGQLEAVGIEIAAMTTDVTSQRPFQLPLQSAHHFFSKADFDALFPARVVKYLVGNAQPLDATEEGGPDDLYPLRIGKDFPVLLVARLSLSFPGLIQAIPLWRRDYQLKTAAGDDGLWRRCVFSDGGISSNMPVHLFDSWLPRRPTFGMAFAAWDPDRHGNERVRLLQRSLQSTDLPTPPIPGVVAFFFAMFNTAKDWQDTLQLGLPGFAERTVEVRLDESKEGGMNLEMPPETIDSLVELGREAGEKLLNEFDLKENRWRRAMSVLPELESGLEAYAAAYRERPVGTDAMSYAELLTQYEQKTITAATKTWREETLAPFAERLAEVGDDVTAARDDSNLSTVQDGPRPAQDASVRLLAEADRRPRSREASSGTGS